MPTLEAVESRKSDTLHEKLRRDARSGRCSSEPPAGGAVAGAGLHTHGGGRCHPPSFRGPGREYVPEPTPTFSRLLTAARPATSPTAARPAGRGISARGRPRASRTQARSTSRTNSARGSRNDSEPPLRRARVLSLQRAGCRCHAQLPAWRAGLRTQPAAGRMPLQA